MSKVTSRKTHKAPLTRAPLTRAQLTRAQLAIATTTTEISPTDISFHPTSFCDADGRLFHWQGGLYRGISDRYAPFCHNLFRIGIVESLVEAGFLIDTELTELSLPDYPLVLEHRQLPFVSYASEWCPAMLKAAAQFTLDMMRHLAQHDLTLDVGTWDILYEGCQPRYVDFCSIAAASTYNQHSWNGVLDDFASYFTNPLRLMSQGKGHLARWLLADYEHRVIHAELAALMGQKIYGKRTAASSSLIDLIAQKFSISRLSINRLREKVRLRRDPCRLDLVQKMQRSLNQIHLPQLALNGYQTDSKAPKSHSKQTILQAVLTKLHPTTILDVGCGSGQYALLAALSGAQVVAVDKDERQVTRCYQAAKAQNLSVLPLVMDIRYPSAAQGTNQPVLVAAKERLACELVMVIDILPHLLFEQYLTLAQAVDAIAFFSTRWLLVELSSPQQTLSTYNAEASASYQTHHLIEQLQAHFSQIEIVNSDSQNPLILCER